MRQLRDIRRLATLYRLRLHAAEAAVASQRSRHAHAQTTLDQAEAALEQHADEEERGERRFLESVLGRPVRREGWDRRDGERLVAAHRRDQLETARGEAADRLRGEQETLRTLRDEEALRRRDCDRMDEAVAVIGRRVARHAEAVAEAESEDLAAVRRPDGSPC